MIFKKDGIRLKNFKPCDLRFFIETADKAEIIARTPKKAILEITTNGELEIWEVIE